MHHICALPGIRDGASNRWGLTPERQLERFLQELTFVPVTVEFWLHGNYYPLAKLLGLEVPFQGQEGTVDVVPGYPMTYTWGSIDGRATDYLTLVGPYDVEALKAAFAKIESVTTLASRSDLEVFVKSAPFEA